MGYRQSRMNKNESTYTSLDIVLGCFLTQCTHLIGEERNHFKETVKELSRRMMDGDSCIYLNKETQDVMWASGLVSEQNRTPLILENDRLYLHRYWHYEDRLGRQVKALLEERYQFEGLEANLNRYFPSDDGIDLNDQKKAARMAVTRRFCIITGGPGTGKTTTIVKIVALLLEISEKPLQIALAAPTGKAAMRMQESITRSTNTLPCSNEVTNLLPETVTTIHRLLGSRPLSPYFYHHSENPLHYDLVLIDEASMVDLALMAKLVDALRNNSRLILLGDKNQLASVESGAVLSDLTEALACHTVILEKSFRFNSNIKALADAVNQQQSRKAWDILLSNKEASNIEILHNDPIEYIVKRRMAYLRLTASSSDFTQIIQVFYKFQVLAANRRGKDGVEYLNREIEKYFSEQGLISRSGSWYSGRPVMINQNDLNLNLYNGDVGICLFDREQTDRLMVFFQRPDGSTKKILPSRLPNCETVFAMTIHKSQGSEFDEVLIVMPERVSPLLTKELLYTAITRARETVKLVTTQAIFTAAVSHTVSRRSGLMEKLR